MEIKYGEHKLKHGLPRIAYRGPIAQNTESGIQTGDEPAIPGGYYISVATNVNDQGREWYYEFQSGVFDSVDEAGEHVGEFMESLPESVTLPVDGIITSED